MAQPTAFSSQPCQLRSPKMERQLSIGLNALRVNGSLELLGRIKRRGVAFASLVLLLLFGHPVKASAQLPPEARAGLWKAQWIISPAAAQRDSVVLHFRKVFTISRVPEHFVVHVSADNQYLLCLNQHEVGRGPALSDLAHWKYETYDLAPLLRPGRNELAATVWNFGVLSPLPQISDRTAFVVEGETDTERVVDTDPSWQVEEDKGVKL